MTDFSKTTGRQHLVPNLRCGTVHFHDWYDVHYEPVDSPPKLVMAFERSAGHESVARQSYDLQYEDLRAWKRLHRYPSGAVGFNQMSGNHATSSSDLRFAENNRVTSCGIDRRKRYTGPAFASPSTSVAAITFKYNRVSGEKGVIGFERQLSRQGRERALKSDAMSSTKMPGLHVSYKAVDIFPPNGRIPKPTQSRPASANILKSQNQPADIDANAAFTKSRRPLSRNLTFSKAPRFM